MEWRENVSQNVRSHNPKVPNAGNLNYTALSRTLTDPFEKRIYFKRTQQNQLTNYDYCIGTITPYSVYFSENNADQYYSPHEREYYLDGRQDAIEIVINYDHVHNDGGHISFFPAIYDNYGDIEDINTWEDSGAGILFHNLSDLPHTYGYHVQISNGKYYITFENMDTLQWFDGYVYNDQDNQSSSFIDFSVSSEHIRFSLNIPNGLSAITSPIIDEWTRRNDETWFKPR